MLISFRNVTLLKQMFWERHGAPLGSLEDSRYSGKGLSEQCMHPVECKKRNWFQKLNSSLFFQCFSSEKYRKNNLTSSRTTWSERSWLSYRIHYLIKSWNYYHTFFSSIRSSWIDNPTTEIGSTFLMPLINILAHFGSLTVSLLLEVLMPDCWHFLKNSWIIFSWKL